MEGKAEIFHTNACSGHEKKYFKSFFFIICFICCIICILGCGGVDLFLFARSSVDDAVGDFLLIENEGRIFFITFVIVVGSFMRRFLAL